MTLRISSVLLVMVLAGLGSSRGQTVVPGRVVAHPEALAGMWETPDGQGGAVGMLVSASTQWTRQAGESCVRE